LDCGECSHGRVAAALVVTARDHFLIRVSDYDEIYTIDLQFMDMDVNSLTSEEESKFIELGEQRDRLSAELQELRR